jgi:hypothetical protein
MFAKKLDLLLNVVRQYNTTCISLGNTVMMLVLISDRETVFSL